MSDLIFPTSSSLALVAQDKLPKLIAERPVFAIFPVTSPDTFNVQWEQRDNYQGLQQVRGINGAPPRVSKVGAKRYSMQPGIYGEFQPIDELEITQRRQYGTFGSPVDITDLVMQAQDLLLQRRLDRIESMLWTLLTAGSFSITGPTGAVLHTDAYTTQTFSSIVPWATAATAAPLADLRAIQLLARGHSVSFGGGSAAYMNQVTWNRMLSNTNAADIGGRRVTGLQTINGPEQMNQVLSADNLPSIMVYDEGYLAEPNRTFTPFIPNGVVVVVGKRPAGQPVGHFQQVRNANNPNRAPGPYQKVIDHTEDQVPALVEVHDGFNGGPTLEFPSAIVVATVS